MEEQHLSIYLNTEILRVCNGIKFHPRTGHSNNSNSHNKKQKKKKSNIYLQLQKRQIGIAVKRPLLALMRHIVLEYCCCLRVISVEAAEDGVDVSRACLALVESDTHYDPMYLFMFLFMTSRGVGVLRYLKV